MLWRKEAAAAEQQHSYGNNSNNNSYSSIEYIQYVIYKGKNEHYGLLLKQVDSHGGSSEDIEISNVNSRKIIVSSLLNNSPAFHCLKEGDILEEIYIDDSSQLLKPSLLGIERLNNLVGRSRSRLTVTISRFLKKPTQAQQQNYQFKLENEIDSRNYEIPKKLLDYDDKTEILPPIPPPAPIREEIDIQKSKFTTKFVRAKKTHFNAQQLNFTIKRGDVFAIETDQNKNSTSDDVKRVVCHQKTLQSIESGQISQELLTNPEIFTEVQLLEAVVKRPVAILGPYTDIASDFLIRYNEDSFEFVQPNENNCIETGHILQVAKNNKHPVIVAMPSVVEKMVEHGDFYPICVFAYSFDSSVVEKIRFLEGANVNFQSEVSEVIDRDFNHVISDRLVLSDPDQENSNFRSWKDELLEKIFNLQKQFVWVTKKAEKVKKSEKIEKAPVKKMKVAKNVSFTEDTKRGSLAENIDFDYKNEISIPYSKNLGFAIMDTVNGITVAQVSTTSRLYKKVQIGDVLHSVNGKINLERAHEVKPVLMRNGSGLCRFSFISGSQEQKRLARSIISDKHVLGMKIKSSEFVYM